jgi:hypothetical protein
MSRYRDRHRDEETERRGPEAVHDGLVVVRLEAVVGLYVGFPTRLSRYIMESSGPSTTLRPRICSEITFRGIILDQTRRKWGVQPCTLLATSLL